MIRAPGFATTALAMARLRTLRLRRGRALWLGTGVTLLVVVAGLAARWGGDADAVSTFHAVTRFGFRKVLVLLVPFLFCATALSEEVEGRTLVYLFTRPAPRGAMLLGKWAAGVLASAAILGAGVVVLWAGCGAGAPGMLGRALAATVLGSACYGAVYLLFGAILVEAPYLLSLLYVGLVELGLGAVPGPVRLVSANHHLGNVLGARANDVLWLTTPTLSALSSAAIVLALTGLFLFLAVLVGAGTEYRTR
jgi:hypothetical protein